MRRRFVEFLVGRNSGPACPNFSLSVLQEFDDGTLCSDVAFHGARDLATDHGLQRRHFRDCVALTDGQQAIGLLPGQYLALTVACFVGLYIAFITGVAFTRLPASIFQFLRRD